VIQTVRVGLWFLAFALSSSGCQDHRFDKERAFLAQAAAEQHKKFRELPPEQQVPLYLASQMMDTPDLAYCQDLRESTGPAALPALLLALSEEKDDRAKRALIGGIECARDPRPAHCDPRLSAIVTTVAKSIMDKATRDEAHAAARTLRCTP
jgi:hypothetical protein